MSPEEEGLIEWRLLKLEQAVETISEALNVLEDFRKEYITQRKIIASVLVLIFGILQPLVITWANWNWGA